MFLFVLLISSVEVPDSQLKLVFLVDHQQLAMSLSKPKYFKIRTNTKTRCKAKYIGYDIYDQYLVYGMSRNMDKIIKSTNRHHVRIPDEISHLIITYIGKRFVSGICKQGYVVRDGIYTIYHNSKQWAVLQHTYLVFYDINNHGSIDKFDMLEYDKVQVSIKHAGRFQIVDKTGKNQNIVLKCKSINDMYDWIQHIKHTINIMK